MCHYICVFVNLFNQGCLRISSIEILFSWSFSSILIINDFPSILIESNAFSFSLIFLFIMDSRVNSIFYLINGIRLKKHAYMTTPMLHTSALFEYGSLYSTSGAEYTKEPHYSRTFSPGKWNVERPKSISFTRVPSWDTRMFSNFKSRCNTPMVDR